MDTGFAPTTDPLTHELQILGGRGTAPCNEHHILLFRHETLLRSIRFCCMGVVSASPEQYPGSGMICCRTNSVAQRGSAPRAPQSIARHRTLLHRQHMAAYSGTHWHNLLLCSHFALLHRHHFLLYRRPSLLQGAAFAAKAVAGLVEGQWSGKRHIDEGLVLGAVKAAPETAGLKATRR